MSDEIKVYVVTKKGRDNFYLRYTDPATGQRVEKCAKTTKRSAADQEAGKWQAELVEGRYQKPQRMTWEAFRDYYAAHGLPNVAHSTQLTYEATLNVFERTCKPQKLASVTTQAVTAFATELRQSEMSDATVGRHLRCLKVIMRWANREGLLLVVPQFTMPKRTKGMKMMRGRGISGEEFERMIEAVPKVVENAAADSWKFYLRGLWFSGLRLSESLTLRWDDAPDSIVVDLDGKRPMLRIPAEVEKGKRDRILPMAPEFAQLLLAVPERERRGRVFKLLASNGKPLTDGRRVCGVIVSAIGKSAGVVVDERTKGGKVVRKFASCHDLRRAFAQRWAGRLMPAQLMELMRHEEIGTTMRYYVGTDAKATAEVIWSAFGNILGNSDKQPTAGNSKHSAK